MKKELLMSNFRHLESLNAALKAKISAAAEKDLSEFASGISALGKMYDGLAAALQMDQLLMDESDDQLDEDELDTSFHSVQERELRRLKK